ncbi:MAG: hypothetical protein LH467_13480 [Gemmatimonadaceae bacterium]|nr:hypothetical protein [Gemmatimonadaceae bacterium]
MLCASASNAQSLSAGDSCAIEIAAARYATQHLFTGRPGRRALDAQTREGVARAPERLAALSKALGIPAAPRDSVIRCDGNGQCRFRRYDELLGINIVSVTDSSADVAVAIDSPSGSKRLGWSVYTQEPMLRLVKRNKKWTFLRVLEIRLT